VHTLNIAVDRQLTFSLLRLYLFEETFLMKALFVIWLLCFTQIALAQTNPRTSSRSAAQYDAASIDENIGDNRDVIYFSQMAMERSSKPQTIEVARDMLADFTGLLYSMEQLATAGGGSDNSGNTANGALQEAKNLNQQLGIVRGLSFDTAWIGGMLRMHQINISQLVEQRANATNDRLKAAIGEAMPVLKRYITRLSTLQKQLIKRDLQEKKEAAKQQNKK
jgi:predicted outer membrane protein